tara:strand:+ start:4315 stop:4938 length:624 start_codon:yes stop_codon:yes gene_type:complete
MSASQEISQLLMQDAAVNKCLTNGVINSRALAKFLIKKYGLTYSEEAVVSAIRRYSPSAAKDNGVGNLLQGAMLFTKSNVSCLTTDEGSQEKFAAVLNDEKLNKNVRISRAKKYTKLFVYEKEFEVLRSHFLDDKVRRVQQNLVELRILLSKDVHDAVGLLAKLGSQLAMYDLPIQEMIVSLPELLVYVKEEDGLKAQEALMKLLSQ